MSLGGESWAIEAGGDIPVPGRFCSWLPAGWRAVGVEGQLKAQAQVEETLGSPQRCGCCGTQRLWNGAALGHGMGKVWCWIGAFWAWKVGQAGTSCPACPVLS